MKRNAIIVLMLSLPLSSCAEFNANDRDAGETAKSVARDIGDAATHAGKTIGGAVESAIDSGKKKSN